MNDSDGSRYPAEGRYPFIEMLLIGCKCSGCDAEAGGRRTPGDSTYYMPYIIDSQWGPFRNGATHTDSTFVNGEWEPCGGVLTYELLPLEMAPFVQKELGLAMDALLILKRRGVL